MKKITILTGCLFTMALASCDFLDREPLDAIGKDQFFTTANATALEILQVMMFYHGNVILPALVWLRFLQVPAILSGNGKISVHAMIF